MGRVAFGSWSDLDVGRIDELRGAIDRNRYIPLLASSLLSRSLRSERDEYVDYYLRIYSAIAEVSGCSTVVDSSKHASLAFCLRSHADLDLRVIHVVRDSRAVAFSWTQSVSRPDVSANSFMTTYKPATAAAHWNTQNAALQLLAAKGVPTLRVRYEDLVAAPALTLAGIARFAGIGTAGSALSFLGADKDHHWAALSPAHTASGNPMRFTTGKIDIRSDERWRAAMPAGQRHTVTAITLPLLTRYGYARSAA